MFEVAIGGQLKIKKNLESTAHICSIHSLCKLLPLLIFCSQAKMRRKRVGATQREFDISWCCCFSILLLLSKRNRRRVGKFWFTFTYIKTGGNFAIPYAQLRLFWLMGYFLPLLFGNFPLDLPMDLTDKIASKSSDLGGLFSLSQGEKILLRRLNLLAQPLRPSQPSIPRSPAPTYVLPRSFWIERFHRSTHKRESAVILIMGTEKSVAVQIT